MLVAVGRLLDSLFFRGFYKQKVEAPVFIVAPPRSGTTLTQNLMSLDDERFVHVKLYQTIFPSVSFQKAIHKLSRIDKKMGHPLGNLMSWVERKCFGGWDNLHKMRLAQPEEDDAFFLYCFVSEAIFLLFPYVDELWEAGFPDHLPEDARRKVMRFYRSCLERHLYVNGPRKTLLSKATQSSGAVDSLNVEFPDAKFITIVRHPYKSVASHVSLFWPVWVKHSPEILKTSQNSKQYARLAVEWYRHLFEFRNRISPERYYCIDYRDLVSDPKSTMEKLYAHFGWQISDAYRLLLEDATSTQREFRSSHKCSLEEFGLSEEWIQEQIGDVLDFYALER
ncbi:MAG: sulfotransferase [Verrucomicrobiota bacterium]|nr:sulfotransferase [Verrucomicrobiota bacterium]